MKTRKTLATLLAATFLLGLVALTPGDSSAANLTAGNYTFLVEGEEVTFTVDPVSRRDGLLAPAEVFSRLAIQVDGQQTRSFTLTTEYVTVKTTLGSPLVEVNGQAKVLPLYPVRLNGRLFLPLELLHFFSIDAVADGTYVMIRDLKKNAPILKSLDQSEYAALRIGRVLTANTKLDSNIYVDVVYTLLGEDMLAVTNLDLPYNTRIELLERSRTNTLVMATVSNTSFKSGAFTTAGLYLVDSHRRQFEVTSVLDIGQGLVTGKIAPGADRTSVLVFPKLAANSKGLTVYYEPNGGSLGSLTQP